MALQVLLVRHAAAAKRDAGRYPRDDERPLTRSGARKFERAAKAIKRLEIAPATVYSSPALRARQTARLLIARLRLPEAALRTSAAIHHSASFASAGRLLSRHSAQECVALVGHEPWLGNFLADCLGSAASEAFPMTKGGACLMEYNPRAKRGTRLRWFLTQDQLIRIGA